MLLTKKFKISADITIFLTPPFLCSRRWASTLSYNVVYVSRWFLVFSLLLLILSSTVQYGEMVQVVSGGLIVSMPYFFSSYLPV